MRWLFVDPLQKQENAERERVIARMEHWWRQFRERQNDLKALFRGQMEWDLNAWMQETLQSISPELMWEYGPGSEENTQRLIITPESERQLRPLVNELLRRAPKLPDWTFHGHRLAEPLDDVVETVRGVCGGDISNTRVDITREKHRRIGLTYYHPPCDSERDPEQVQFAAYIATEALLGEEMLDRWIGSIQVVDQAEIKDAESFENSRPLARLKPTIEAIVGSITDQLPSQPCFRYVPAGRWSGYEIHPTRAVEYARRDDLYVAISGRPDVFEAFHNGVSFYSDTLSRCGETFCYLKIDGQGHPDSYRAHCREQVQTAIDELFVPNEIGCVIGGGTGLRYTYVDLAIVNIVDALPLLRRVAQQFAFPPRSWLHFCDDELSEEWAPLVPGLEYPPMAVKE